jgi:hypothetical protein
LKATHSGGGAVESGAPRLKRPFEREAERRTSGVSVPVTDHLAVAPGSVASTEQAHRIRRLAHMTMLHLLMPMVAELGGSPSVVAKIRQWLDNLAVSARYGS